MLVARCRIPAITTLDVIQQPTSCNQHLEATSTSMSENRNTEDLRLLKEHPDQLMASYQPIIETVVAGFIRRGFFDRTEKMDVVQNVNTLLLEKKLSKIKEHFNGSVYLRTYFSKVVYNTCLELTRKKARQPIITGEELLQHETSNLLNPEEQLAIKDELRRVEALLKGFRKKEAKSLLCLKLYAKKWLDDSDLEAYSKLGFHDELAMIRSSFFENYEAMPDKSAYEVAVLLFNKLENKANSADSLRKWTNAIVDNMIAILNGEPPVYHHTRDTIRILLQMYFTKS